MKYISFILLFCIAAFPAFSQSVSVTAYQEHARNNTQTFPINDNTISVSGGQIQFADRQLFDPASWSIAGQKSKLSFLMRRDALLLQMFDNNGIKLVEKELEFFNPSDNTLKVYQFDDGRTVVRDNVASFSFFDAGGNPIYTISNSSQSVDGERESQLAADKAGRTIVLYNPVIAYGSDTGSRARILFGEDNFETLFNDTAREIKHLQVSDDGSFVSIIVTTGSSDTVLIFDRFGNELFSYDSENQLRGISLSDGGLYLTTFTSNRIQVYQIATGELLGSASSQSLLVTASYHPGDETIIGLGGSISNGLISSPTVTAVHIAKRQIVREQVDLPLSTLGVEQIGISRTSPGQYSISGLNRELDIRASF